MYPIVQLKQLFEKLYKKNKPLVIIVVYIVLFSLVQLLGGIFYKYMGIIDYLQDSAISHESKINSIDSEVESQIKNGVVTRKSFNDYIKRKDTEYHEQMTINNFLFNKIGFLEGVHKAEDTYE